MATSGTPYGGLDLIATRAYISGASMSLVCYLNAADSLGDATVVADLVQPSTANGYAPITLTNSNWSVSDGVLTYDTGTDPANPQWSATGSWTGTVYGTAIIYGTDVVHFKDLDVPFNATAGRKLQIDLSTVVGP